MSTTEITELLQAVKEINEELYNQQPEDDSHVLGVTIEPCLGYVVVEWWAQVIYSSENEDREYKDDTDDTGHVASLDSIPEPWQPYLRKKIQQVVEQVSRIKL